MTRRSATLEPVEEQVGEDIESWAAKYLVQAPRTVDTNATRFDKYKSRYMGRYNSVDQSKCDMSYAEFAQQVSQQQLSFKVGDHVVGTVSSFEGPQRAYIEIGAKTHALLPLHEATIAPLGPGDRIDDLVDMGEQYEFEVVSDYRDDGMVVVSIRKIMYERAWSKLTEWYAEDPVFEAPVVQVNRGGAIVLVEGLRAFLPGSHLLGGVHASEEMVGKVLSVKFLEVNKEGSKLVVSHKRAVIEHSMENIKRGDVVEGRVAAVKPYGAFVDINGLSGLLHISQISCDRVVAIDETLKEGMAIKCMIIDHDKANGRIALSTKTLEPEPGDMLRDPQLVFDMAEASAAKYHARIEAERAARERAAKEMVLGLGNSLVDGLGSDEDDDLDTLDNLDDLQEQPAEQATDGSALAIDLSDDGDSAVDLDFADASSYQDQEDAAVQQPDAEKQSEEAAAAA